MIHRSIVAVILAAVPSLLAAQEKVKEPAAPALPAAATDSPAAAAAETAQRITLPELKKLVEAKNVLIVDVRSAEAYKEGHIAGAVSAPLAEIEKHLTELKAAKKPIVTYCT